MSLSSSLFIFTTFKIFRFFRSAKKTEYSGMTIQVGNPSFLYEEMLDYEDNNVHPEVDNGQEKVTWSGGGGGGWNLVKHFDFKGETSGFVHLE